MAEQDIRFYIGTNNHALACARVWDAYWTFYEVDTRPPSLTHIRIYDIEPFNLNGRIYNKARRGQYQNLEFYIRRQYIAEIDVPAEIAQAVLRNIAKVLL